MPLFGEAKFLVEPKSDEVFVGYNSLHMTNTTSPSIKELEPLDENTLYNDEPVAAVLGGTAVHAKAALT